MGVNSRPSKVAKSRLRAYPEQAVLGARDGVDDIIGQPVFNGEIGPNVIFGKFAFTHRSGWHQDNQQEQRCKQAWTA